MPRYIDADIVRSAKNPYDEEISEYERGWNAACDAIAADAPTADVVPVVRCKECKWYEETDARIGTCLLVERGAEINGFCAWGERRDDDEKGFTKSD